MQFTHETIPSEVVDKAHKNHHESPYISLAQLEQVCERDVDLEGCLQEVVSSSIKYTETVCRFKQIVSRGHISNEDGARAEIEKIRSTTHDAAMDSVKVLSRQLKEKGKDNSWISRIAMDDRPGYGRFLILIAFEFVLKNTN